MIFTETFQYENNKHLLNRDGMEQMEYEQEMKLLRVINNVEEK